MFLVFISAVLLLSAVLAVLLRWRRSSSALGKRGSSPYEIEQCPNPNCVRCRGYKTINASAQRRLFWVIRTKEEQTGELRRIVEAVRLGPKHDNTRRASNTSPAHGQCPTVLLVRGLSTRPIVTNMHLEACQSIYRSEHTKYVMDEYLQALQPQQGLPVRFLVNDVQGAGWKVLDFLNQGVWRDDNLRACPHTAALIRQSSLRPFTMDGCLFGNVFISVVEPGTVITPHCGPTNVRHRLHVGLDIPTAARQRRDGSTKDNNPCDEPSLTVMDRQVRWETGRCFVFDDSLVHRVDYPASLIQSSHSSVLAAGASTSAADSAPLPRVVLIVDLWHAELTQAERRAITQLYPSCAA